VKHSFKLSGKSLNSSNFPLSISLLKSKWISGDTTRSFCSIFDRAQEGRGVGGICECGLSSDILGIGRGGKEGRRSRFILI
jgi:hypothetical protein